MALSQAKKDKLKELELNKSGVAFVSEKSHVKPNPTIIISLGGLGGRTVNMLKGKFEKEIGSSDKVFFRVIDTCVDDTNKISKVKNDGTRNSNPNAYMDSAETITLYEPIIEKLLYKESIPQNIKEWLNPSLIGTPLKGDGAQQIRQIGRAMLVNDHVYGTTRSKLSTVINSAIEKANEIDGANVDVIVIAGISGGTGSGTIIDIPYMIHDLFTSVGFSKYTLAGYIYTPDAQFEENGIKDNDNIKLNLKTNGYSALKEIDYFMNIVETGSNYSLKLGVKSINSNKNIFSTCTLVSGYSETGGINKMEVTMGRLTDQLMDMLTDISFVDSSGQPVQLAESLMSNESAMLNAWFRNHPNRKDFHRYASYKYQVLGYNAIKIPRDEILAYCVNKIYENVLTEFTNFQKVNKQMLDEVYKATSTDSILSVRQYVLGINPQDPIRRNIFIEDNIKKSMISNNPMYGYQLAVNMANYYSQKITPVFRSQFEAKLFEDLSKQIDKIFDTYGPYMALKAIEHKSNELNVGNPDEPFSGIVEQLYLLGNQFKEQAKNAKNTFANGGQAKVNQLASEATKLLGGKKEMAEYKDTCAKLAVITDIDAPLYDLIADGLYNVADEMNKLNSRLFEVYTSVLTEIQRILNKDGQYFAQSKQVKKGNHTSYSVDILSSGKAKAQHLEQYLNSFISRVAVEELAQNFIKTMRNNKEKWLAENKDDDFDVVTVVRDLMDECLIHNNMRNDIIEKFVVVAYNNQDISADELDTMWANNNPGSPKMEALTNAAMEIYNVLNTGARTLAQSNSISFKEFTSQIYIGTLADTPLLSKILAEIISNQGQTPVTSNAKNKFIVTQRYFNLPMYILNGMADFNQQYISNAKAGRHMDENKENWGRFPNPYTIDSVAKDISTRNEVPEMIYNNPDYQLLTKVRDEVDEGIDVLHSINLYKDPVSQAGVMYLMDIVSEPDKESFKEALTKKMKRNKDFDLIEFMKENGYIINQVLVNTGNTDINLNIRDLSQTNEDKYIDLPVPIADVYKWIRKSIKYMDIIEKNNPKFKEIMDLMSEIETEMKGKKQFIDHVEIFAFALRAGLIKQKTPDKNTIWNYMNGNEPVTVNLTTKKTFDKKFYLYNVFSKFTTLEEKRLEMLRAQAVKIIENGDQVDCDSFSEHIEYVLGDECLGDPFNWEEINDEAVSLGIAENYQIADLNLSEPDPAKDLKRFYELLLSNME